MKPVSARNIREFLDRLANDVGSEWILLGGCILPSLGLEFRATLDIDIVNKEGDTTESTLKLMKLAETFSWPPEIANSAAVYFLDKIENYESDAEDIRRYFAYCSINDGTQSYPVIQKILKEAKKAAKKSNAGWRNRCSAIEAFLKNATQPS